MIIRMDVVVNTMGQSRKGRNLIRNPVRSDKMDMALSIPKVTM